MQLSDTYALPISVSSRPVGDQTLVMDLETSSYFELNSVGSYVWERIGRGETVGEIIAAVCQQFEVTAEVAEADVRALVGRLLERRLIETA